MIKNIIIKISQNKNILSFFSLKIIAEGISFLIPLIIAKFTSPDIFGSFSLFKMILFFGTSIFIGPLLTPLSIESNKECVERGKSNHSFTSSLVFLLFSVSFFLLVFSFLGDALISFTGLSYDEYKNIFLLAFLGLGSRDFVAALFMGHNNKKAHINTYLIYSISLLLLIFSLHIFKIFTLKNIFISFALSGLISFFASLPSIDYKKILPLSFSMKQFHIIANFSMWNILGYTSSYLLNWGDNIVLRQHVSLSDIGVYNFAYQIFKGFIMITLTINSYYAPYIAKNIKNKEIIINYLANKRKKIMHIISILVPLSLILIFILIGLFFDESYNFGIIIFLILSPSIIISAYLAFYFPIFNSSKKYKIPQILLISQVFTNLLLNIILVPNYGIIGASVATLLSYLLYLLLYVISYRKIFTFS